jgi:hypothetical protein
MVGESPALIILVQYLSVSQTYRCLPLLAAPTSTVSRHPLLQITQQLMEDAEKSEDGGRVSRHYESIQNGTFNPFPRPNYRLLTGPSPQDALRTSFQPVKTNDPRVDFLHSVQEEVG